VVEFSLFVLLQQFPRFLKVGRRRGCTMQGLVGGFFHGNAGHQARHVQVVGAFHQPGHQGWRQARGQHRDVEGTGQGAVADVGGEHGRKGRGHHADEEVEHHGNDQQARKYQPELAAVDQHEGRNGQAEQRDAAEEDKGPAANFVADKADQWLYEQHADHDRDDDQHPMVFAVVQVVREVARHVGEQHVVSDVGHGHHADAGHQAAPVLGGDFLEGHFRASRQAFAVSLFQFFDMLLEGRGLFECVTQIESDYAKGQGEEKRQAPAPRLELLFAYNGRNQHHQACPEDKPCN